MIATTRRVWTWLGTVASVRVITAGMLVYALIIGALVFGYARVSGCLASYADTSARSTTARARIAVEDRALDEADRAAAARADVALDTTLQALAGPPDARKAAFENLLKVRAEVAQQRAQNNATRQRNEEERRRNPVPQPPSQTC